MAIHKAKVIGPYEVAGARTGRTVELDDEQVNLAALIDAGHIELILEPAPEKVARTAKKGDN